MSQVTTYLELEKLRPNPHQPRNKADLEEILLLAASIKSDGQLQAITVTPDGEGKYFIVIGHRRVAAFQHLQANYPDEKRWAKIMANLITPPMSDDELFRKSVVENVQRADLSVQDKALVVQAARNQFDYSFEQAAELLGLKTRSAAHKLHSLLAHDEFIWRLINSGQLGQEQARLLLPLRSFGDDWPERAATTIIDQGLTTTATADLVYRMISQGGGKEVKSPDDSYENHPEGCVPVCGQCEHLIRFHNSHWCSKPELHQQKFAPIASTLLNIPCPRCGGEAHMHGFYVVCHGCNGQWPKYADFQAEGNRMPEREEKEQETYEAPLIIQGPDFILDFSPPEEAIPPQACHICLDPEGLIPVDGETLKCKTCQIELTLLELAVLPWASAGEYNRFEGLFQDLDDEIKGLVRALVGLGNIPEKELVAECLKRILTTRKK